MAELLDNLATYLSKAPPSWVLWITTGLATLLLVLQIREYWIKRRRLELWKLVAEQYYVEFGEERAAQWDYMSASFRSTDPLECFTVLEFTLTNKYHEAITVGRINISGWMYQHNYTRGLYDHARDYRVYDLHTSQETSLSFYGAIQPGHTIGFRIEAYEHQGSTFGTVPRNPFAEMRSRLPIDLPKRYTVEVQTSVGTKDFTMKVDKTEKIMGSYELATVYHLSGTQLLVNEPQPHQVRPPQGVHRTDLRLGKLERVRWELQNAKYKSQVWWKRRKRN